MRSGWTILGLTAVTAFGVCLAAGPETVPHGTVGPASYRIKLEHFVAPGNRAAGLLVKARLNGGPMLRLLVDSGSQYVVLDRAAAQHSHCAGGSALDLIGAGAASATPAQRQVAETLEVGDLILRGVPVVVTGHNLADGIQGVLPLSIFSEFLIRLDFPARELDLLPFGATATDRSGTIPALSLHRLLFIKGTVNEARDGYFLVDTGAAFTAVSRELVRQLHIPEIMADRVPLHGSGAELDAPLLTGSLRLQLLSQQIVQGPVVAVDLSATSRYHGLEISGLLGYSALCDSVLIANYRDRIVRIEPK